MVDSGFMNGRETDSAAAVGGSKRGTPVGPAMAGSKGWTGNSCLVTNLAVSYEL